MLRFLFDHAIVPIAYSPIGRPDDGTNGATDILDNSLVISLAEKYGKSPVQIVLAWGVSRGYSVIPRSGQLDH